MLTATQVSEGLRIFFHGLKVRILGYRKYPGNDIEICRNIIHSCWNGKYFQTSTGHFSQFYTRDFGWCTESLIDLGYREEVRKTLQYALKQFSQHGRITTTLTPQGKPFDFPRMAVDSLPWLLHSIKLLNDASLLAEHREFLIGQVSLWVSEVIDTETGLVKKDRQFSSMKDYSIRYSSCYDNSCVAMLKKDLSALHIPNPLKNYPYEELLRTHFWNGSYFTDDLTRKKYVAGDANIAPFWIAGIQNKNLLRLALRAIILEGLDSPFPLRYARREAHVHMIPWELFSYGYERDTIWAHMGLPYIDLLGKINPHRAEMHIEAYKRKILHHKNFIEVYTLSGIPFTTPFYAADSGMLWASNYLRLTRKLNGKYAKM
jgi:hypothetical protein